MKRTGGNKNLSKDSVSHAYIKANKPDKICKINNPWWVYNTVREYIRSTWKKAQKERKAHISIAGMEEKGRLTDFTEDLITKEYLNFIMNEVISFIRKRYPKAHSKYTFYFEIFCYKKKWGVPWEEIQEKFPGVNTKEVQSRISEILKKFKKYHTKKQKKWKSKMLFS